MSSMDYSEMTKTQREKALLRLVELIEGANKEIRLCEKMGGGLMVRQAKHLKGKYVKDILLLLSFYQIPLKLTEAA